MTREEAMTLLAACRPEDWDANDPRLAEAFDLLERDPELQAWFDREQATDRALAAKLKAAPLPPDLEAQVLAGTKALLSGRPTSRWPMLLLAACVAMLGLITALWMRPEPAPTPGSFAAYRLDMVRFLQEFPALDLTTDRLEAVRSWMKTEHPRTGASLPGAFEPFPSIGCRTVEWNGRKVALICFMAEGEIVHLLVIPRGELPPTPLEGPPVFGRVGSQTTAAWATADNLYLVISQAREAQLRKWLG